MTYHHLQIDRMCIDAIRCLAMDAVQKANSGHPGTPMSQATMAYTLWTKFMKHNPINPDWIDRDRFILSCGHASMLLYAVLYLSGYDLSLDDIKSFRQFGSRTPGHPERGKTPGVEFTTGPLGQGISSAVGMAMAERWLSKYFNRDEYDIINHRTFVFASDGDLMEGVTHEAASLAGHLGLDKLIVVYDNNKITIEGDINLAFTENVRQRFEAYGWRVIDVTDGEDLLMLMEAFDHATKSCGKPTLIVCNTIIGFPSPNKKNTASIHGAPLGEEEVYITKKILKWDTKEDFLVPDNVLEEWRRCVIRGIEYEDIWEQKFRTYSLIYPDLAREFESMINGVLPPKWEESLPSFDTSKQYATREASGIVINALSNRIVNLIGGSADLSPSTHTYIKCGGDFGSRYDKDCGRNIHWGVREHAMGATLNGMSAHGGLHVFGATFFVFSDYMRPSVRLAALMQLPVKYIWTHDSIGVGEDGPTHQPIEQLMSFRMIPNMTIIRPADSNETVEAWRFAMKYVDGPVGIVLSRQKLPVLNPEKTKNALYGGYILKETENKQANVILIATGSEVHLALSVWDKLVKYGIGVRVVSMPCLELFKRQSIEYQESVLPTDVKVNVCIEAGITCGWSDLINRDVVRIGVNSFGVSAPSDVLFSYFGLDVDNIVKSVIKSLLENK